EARVVNEAAESGVNIQGAAWQGIKHTIGSVNGEVSVDVGGTGLHGHISHHVDSAGAGFDLAAADDQTTNPLEVVVDIQHAGEVDGDWKCIGDLVVGVDFDESGVRRTGRSPDDQGARHCCVATTAES